jgi:hypothetical protein
MIIDIMKKYDGTQHKNTHHDDNQHNSSQHDDTHHEYNQHDNLQHNNIRLYGLYCDTQNKWQYAKCYSA